jgi:hypothetical protein
MSQLRHSTIRFWLTLAAVLFSAGLSAPVAASSCVVPSTAVKTQAKSSCEMAACCCEAGVLSTQGHSAQMQPPGCDCSVKPAAATSDPAEASARAFTMVFGLPVDAALTAVDVIRGPCLNAFEDHRPSAGIAFRKPSRAPPVDRR